MSTLAIVVLSALGLLVAAFVVFLRLARIARREAAVVPSVESMVRSVEPIPLYIDDERLGAMVRMRVDFASDGADGTTAKVHAHLVITEDGAYVDDLMDKFLRRTVVACWFIMGSDLYRMTGRLDAATVDTDFPSGRATLDVVIAGKVHGREATAAISPTTPRSQGGRHGHSQVAQA